MLCLVMIIQYMHFIIFQAHILTSKDYLLLQGLFFSAHTPDHILPDLALVTLRCLEILFLSEEAGLKCQTSRPWILFWSAFKDAIEIHSLIQPFYQIPEIVLSSLAKQMHKGLRNVENADNSLCRWRGSAKLQRFFFIVFEKCLSTALQNIFRNQKL